jgi:hypothetical protein
MDFPLLQTVTEPKHEAIEDQKQANDPTDAVDSLHIVRKDHHGDQGDGGDTQHEEQLLSKRDCG